MPIQIAQVDAFTNRPFAGNPAAVCFLQEPREDRWMQDVAREMNLSETAFVRPEEDGFNLRWFTPAVEVDLCGHATLAAAHVLWEEGRLEPGTPARFHTRSGMLSAQRRHSWIELDFPALPVTLAQVPAALSDALGKRPVCFGYTRFDALVELASEQAVRDLKPDFAALARLPVRGVIVTSRAESAEFDFVSRFFAPGSGINEDPVTGSAHCALAPFWGERLGRAELVGYQASARGGMVHVRLGRDRVYLAGQAVTVLRGELLDSTI